MGLVATLKQSNESAVANTKLSGTVDQLNTSTREIQRMTVLNNDLQRKLLDQAETISGWAKQGVNSVTGGDSFCFMTLAQDKNTL